MKKDRKHKIWHRLSYAPKSLIVIIILLIAIRLAIPPVAKWQINKTLANDLTDYTGSIEDFDLVLIAGTYKVQGLKLKRRSAPKDDYFIQIKEIEVDVSWEALFKGKVLVDLTLHEPKILVHDAGQQAKKQNGTEEKNWNKAVDSIIPLDLQSIEVANGTLGFIRKDSTPKVEVYLDEVYVTARNLGNVLAVAKNAPPASYEMKGRLQKHAQVRVKGHGNFLASPLKTSSTVSLQKLKVKTLNDLTKSYGYFDLTEGELSVTGKVSNSDMYVKLNLAPEFRGIDVIAPAQKFLGIRGFFTELAVGLVNFLFKDKNKIASTVIKGEGKLPDGFELDTWAAVKGLFNPVEENREEAKKAE